MKINFQNMCSLRKISCGLIFSMAISLVACGSDNDEEGGDNGNDGLVEDTYSWKQHCHGKAESKYHFA